MKKLIEAYKLLKLLYKNTVLIVVDYEKFKLETYKGCYLSDRGVTLAKSYTGCFDDDFKAMLTAGGILCKSTGQTLVCSSSVNDWFMDSNIE